MILCVICFFFKQKTAYEVRISDWSSDVCSSDLSQKGDMKIRRNMFAEHKMPFLKPNWLENDPHSPLYWRSGDHHSTRNILIIPERHPAVDGKRQGVAEVPPKGGSSIADAKTQKPFEFADGERSQGEKTERRREGK